MDEHSNFTQELKAEISKIRKQNYLSYYNGGVLNYIFAQYLRHHHYNMIDNFVF